MTGQKNRFKTTERLWDIDDKQLKTPKHDAMVLWLMDENNLFQYESIWGFPKIIESEEYIGHGNYEVVDKKYGGVKIQSEQPIMSSPTFIAGYADLIITPKYGYLRKDIDKIIWGEESDFSCLIEIKPYIDSFGAVLRQLKSYQRFWIRSRKTTKKICLFTLDTRFDAQLESQEINVLHPPEDVTVDDMMDMYGLR